MSLKELADELAKRGRFGDTALVHMNPAEVAGLASLAPGGRLPLNPETGLPEAFFFLPFLAGLGAAAAPAAATAAAAIPAMTAATAAPALAGMGALGAGMSAGMTAATSALPAAAAAAVPTAAEIATAAIPAAATAVPEAAAAAALPTASQAMGAAGVAPALSISDPAMAAIGAGPMANAPLASHGILGAAKVPMDASGLAGLPPAAANAPAFTPLPASASPVSSISPSLATDPILGGQPLSALGGPATTPPPANVTPFAGSDVAEMAGGFGSEANLFPPAPSADSGGLGGLFGGKFDLMQLAPLAMMMPRGGGGKEKKEGKKDISGVKYEGGDPVFPGGEYRGGIDPEWDYFPRYRNGGLVKKYANGGLASLGPQMPQQVPQQQMMAPQMPAPGLTQPPSGGIMSGLEMAQQSPVPSKQIGSPYGGKKDEELIQETVAALQGQHPDPDKVLMEFVKTFGEQALQDLIARLGSMQQPSDGMSDSIPAMIDGVQPAAISSGEYIVPADVVSGLGNGSTDAGASALDGMVQNTRKMRTGGVVQPPPINPRQVMPI